jgi:hypothetical protein
MKPIILSLELFKELAYKSFLQFFAESSPGVFEVRRQRSLLSLLLSKAHLPLFSNTCFSDRY